MDSDPKEEQQPLKQEKEPQEFEADFSDLFDDIKILDIQEVNQDLFEPEGEDKDFQKTHKQKKKKKRKKGKNLWPIKAFVLTLCLAFVFSFVSEVVLSASHIAIGVLLVLTLIAVSVLFDLMSMAFASCELAPFVAMSARKVRGAKTCVKLLQKAEIVSNIFSDIIGDICAIISGAAGTAIIFVVIRDFSGSFWPLFFTVLTSSLISALTVGAKAFAKKFGIDKAHSIVFFVGKLLSIFSKEK